MMYRHWIIVLALFVLKSVPHAFAQAHIHETQESFRHSGYEFLWDTIWDEFDTREFEQDQDAEQYQEMMDIIIRTGAVYAQPYRNIRFGTFELYPDIIELDEDPPLYAQYRYHGTVAQNGSDSPSDDFEGHADALVRIAERMEGAEYPSYVIGATWIRAAEFYRDAGLESSSQAMLARDRGMDELVRAAYLQDVAPEHREFVAERVSNFGWKYSALNEKDKELLCERFLTDTGVDRWVAHFAIGKLLMQRGWDARGDGWAHEVSREQWASFSQYMNEAYGYLMRAWEAHPHWVLTQAQLINIDMAADIDSQRDEHFWFQDALRYRADHDGVWDNYARAIMPRWGGSLRAMYALLDHAIELHNNPSSMAYIVVDLMADITWSEEDAHLVLLDAEYLNTATQLMRDELAAPTPCKNVWQHRMMLRTLAMGQYKSGNLVVASELLRAGGGMTDTVRYPWAETSEFTRHAPMLSTAASEDIIAALQATRDRDLKTAHRALKNARRTLVRDTPNPDIHGDPIGEIDRIMDSISSRMPRVPFYAMPVFQIVAGVCVLVMIGFLVFARIRSQG